MSNERMREIRRRKARRRRQRALKDNAIKIGIMQVVIILVISIMALTNMDSKAEQITARHDALVEHESVKTLNVSYESNEIDYQATTKAPEVSTEADTEHYHEFTYGRDWDVEPVECMMPDAKLLSDNQEDEDK